MTALVMPNVFVIPPEEDNDPPFCCFDATYPRERYIPTEEDLEATGSALEIISRQLSNKSPIFHRGGHTNGVVMPRRSDGRSIEEVRGEEDYQDPDITIRDGNSPGNDSEIIEVIKVRRHTQDERENQLPSVSETAAKSSKSLKSRASRAFNSLKNVGRSVSRSRIIPEVVTSDAETSRAPSPTPSRRGSMIFSLFSHSPSLESRSSFDSFNESPPSSVTEASTPEAFDVELHSPSSAEMQGFVPYPDTDDDGEGEDDMETTPRAPRRHCPSPALHPSVVPSSVPRLNRRRFSVLSLFTASKDSERSDAGSSTPTSPSIPTLDSLSRDSLGPSRTDSTESSSSSGPTTPVDEAFPDPLPNRPSISMLKRLPSFSRSPRKKEATPLVIEPIAPNSPVALGEIGEPDLSFGEIRLDSLHFDELSFDAGRF